MKSLVRCFTIAAGLLVFVGIGNAGAQIDEPIRFTTAFPFTVGTASLPPGTYTLRTDDDNTHVLELTGKHATVFFQTESTRSRRPPARTEVVFQRYGNAYVLKNVWLEGMDEGFESLAQEGEKHVAKHGRATEHRVAARKASKSAAGS